jgi:hypothetical protein
LLGTLSVVLLIIGDVGKSLQSKIIVIIIEKEEEEKWGRRRKKRNNFSWVFNIC